MRSYRSFFKKKKTKRKRYSYVFEEYIVYKLFYSNYYLITSLSISVVLPITLSKTTLVKGKFKFVAPLFDRMHYRYNWITR